MIDAMHFSHYTDEDEITPRSVEQEPLPRRGVPFKPRGLWVSVDGEDDWPSWAAAEQFSIGRNRFHLVLADGPLVLATAGELIQFTRSYGITDDRHPQGCWGIDWPRVASEYPGIIIAPYQWSLRLTTWTSWYYPWDCASGCIWDASVVTSVVRADHART